MSDNDNYVKPENEQKRMTIKPKALSPMQQLEAISWAAKEAGSSYGPFSARLTEEEKVDIYIQYEAWQKERAQKLREKMAQRSQ